jgi:hypothetical protein
MLELELYLTSYFNTVIVANLSKLTILDQHVH